MPPRAAKKTLASRIKVKPRKIQNVEVESVESNEEVWTATFNFPINKKWFSLKYGTGEFVIDSERKDVMYEIASMIKNEGDEIVYARIKNVSGPDDILWNQPHMDPTKKKIAEEIIELQMETKTRIGPGLCTKCGCTSIMYETKNRLGMDEGIIEKCTCTACSKQWRS